MTLTKFLVVATFTIVFVLGTAFISGAQQENTVDLKDLDKPFQDEVSNFEENLVPRKGRSLLETSEQENTDQYWDDVIDSDDDEDSNISVPHYKEKNTFTKNSTKKRYP